MGTKKPRGNCIAGEAALLIALQVAHPFYLGQTFLTVVAQAQRPQVPCVVGAAAALWDLVVHVKKHCAVSTSAHAALRELCLTQHAMPESANNLLTSTGRGEP